MNLEVSYVTGTDECIKLKDDETIEYTKDVTTINCKDKTIRIMNHNVLKIVEIKNSRI